jgi:hypothetical protein
VIKLAKLEIHKVELDFFDFSFIVWTAIIRMLMQLATEEATSVDYPVVQVHILHVSDMDGSLDCLYLGWRVYIVAWQGQFEGAKVMPTLIIEVCA